MLTVAGELDLYSNPTLLARIDEVSGNGARIAVDLTDVTFVDSSGLGALVGALMRAEDNGEHLILIAPEEAPLSRMLSLTGLDQLLHPLPDRTALRQDR